jgi:DNA topoisomerase-3
MAEKLLKDKYCLVKLKEGEQEIIKVLQLGVRNGRAVYRLVDVPKKDTSAKQSVAEAALHAEQKKI